MNKLIYASIVLGLLSAFVLIGCNDNDNNNLDSDSQIIGLVWDTQGGGDINFSIERVGVDYQITAERYLFNPIDVSIALTSNDLEVYVIVDDIFKNVVDVNEFTFTPQGETGTWTQITLIYSESQDLEIDHIDPNGDLKILHDLVEQNLPSA